MPSPDLPRSLSAQLWLSLFRVRAGDHPDRPPGIHGVAFVSYGERDAPSSCELLVGRPLSSHRGVPLSRRWTVTDVWGDSPGGSSDTPDTSRDPSRDPWVRPATSARFRRITSGRHLQHTRFEASLPGQPVASALFDDLSTVVPRLPLAGSLHQHRDDGQEVVTPWRGRGRVLPCNARWRFDPEGPLGWIGDDHNLASFRVADLDLTCGEHGAGR